MAANKSEKPTEKVQDEELLKAVDERIAAMLEEAEKRAEEKAQAIIQAAEEKAAAITEEAKPENDPVAQRIAKMNEDNEEYVTVKLFKDTGKYKDDAFVAVNGEGCNIPRGIPVRIKKKFLRALEASDRQDYQAAQMMEQKEGEYLEESKARNL